MRPRCGGVLSIRPDDEDGVLRDRIVRHRQYARGVLRMIEVLGIPLLGIDATAEEATVERRATEAVAALATSANHRG